MDAFQQWELDEQLRHVARVLGPEYLKNRVAGEATEEAHHAQGVDWLAFAVGIGALAVGGVLCTGELWGRPEHLWKFGMAVALIGQIALLIGLWQPPPARRSPQNSATLGRAVNRVPSPADTSPRGSPTRKF